MNNLQAFGDKTAIGLSLFCALHCLALPLMLALIPSIAALPLADEAFHLWMLAAVIPTSIFALTVGCQKHKRNQLLITGFIGIGCLIAAVTLGEQFGELWEKGLTLVGAAIIASAHLKNFKLCRADRHDCGTSGC